MNEASKAILVNTIKEWAKFSADRDKLTLLATDVADMARKCVHEGLVFLKTQNIDVEADHPESMKIMKMPIHIDPVIEANFPNADTHQCRELALRELILGANALNIRCGDLKRDGSAWLCRAESRQPGGCFQLIH